jgi:LssY C-terminus
MHAEAVRLDCAEGDRMGSSIRSPGGRRLASRVLVVPLAIAVVLGGCVSYQPRPLSAVPFQERILRERKDGVLVGVAALGRNEARALFGVSLGAEGIQPVWLEIANGGRQPLAFFQQSVDSGYFAPAEAAYKSHFSATRRLLGFGLAGIPLWPLWLVAPVQAVSAHFANRKMDALFQQRGIGNHLLGPGEDASGFVFTHLDEGTKSVDVALLGPEGDRRFHFLAPVPGLSVEPRGLSLEEHYGPAEVEDLDLAALPDALIALPCCTTNAKAARNGDPLNLVVVGSYAMLLEAFTRAGWDETETLALGTSLKTAKAFLRGSAYRYSPVSPLYLFSRPQDVAFQKARETIHQRNHLRLWLAPMRFQGLPVWVGQVSRDIGVKFTLRTWNLTTHAIDGDIDDSRENVVGDLLQTRRVAEVGYLAGVGASDPARLPTNLTGDPYWTDGLRAVVELAREPVEPRFFGWRRAEGRGGSSSAEPGGVPPPLRSPRRGGPAPGRAVRVSWSGLVFPRGQPFPTGSP